MATIVSGIFVTVKLMVIFSLAPMGGSICDIVASLILGPTGLTNYYYPFFYESCKFYWDGGHYRAALGLGYPGFASKEDFTAYKELWAINNDHRLYPRNYQKGELFFGDQAMIRQIVLTAVVVGAYYLFFRTPSS